MIRPLLLIIRPTEVIEPCWQVFCTGCILGRTPRTKETLPDFC